MQLRGKGGKTADVKVDKLDEYLRTLRENGTSTSITELNKKFPRRRDDIKTYVFLGLLEPASFQCSRTLISKLI